MARVVIKRDFAEDVIKRTNEKVETLLNTISTLGVKLNTAKTIYTSDNTSGASFDDMSETINKIISSYSTLTQKFQAALRSTVEVYSESDKKIASNVNAVTAVPLTGEMLSEKGDYFKKANSATNAINKKFLNKDQLVMEYFEKGGNYEFEYRNDGSVKVIRDGEPVAFTSKSDADFFTEQYYNQSNSTAYQEGKTGVKGKTYGTFTEKAEYEAGQTEAISKMNLDYDIGVIAAINNERDSQKTIDGCHFSNKDAIDRYEQGIHDASINKNVADTIIENTKEIGNTK